MALNFMGLGFTFGAKDEGLEEKQRSIADGFARINLNISGLNKNAAQMTLPGIVDALPQEQVQSFDEAVQNLGDTIATDLPDQARRGAIGFGRRGDEIVGTQKEVGEGFGLIEKAVKKLDGILRQSKLQTFIQSLALNKLNQIKDGIAGIATSGGELTTSFEAMGVAAAKSAKQAAFQMGVTGKTAQKFTAQATAMHIGQNISVETATKALVNFSKNSKLFGMIGFKSASQVAKAAEVGAIEIDDLRSSLQTATGVLKMGEPAVKHYYEAAFQMGKVTQDVGGAIKFANQNLGMLSEYAVSTGNRLTGMQLAEFGASASAAAAGLFEAGISAEEAKDTSLALAKAMIGTQTSLSKMFSGTEQDISGFAKELAVITGDITVGFDMMRKGPQGFVTGMASMFKAAKEKGVDTGRLMAFVRDRLEQAGVEGSEKLSQLTKVFDQLGPKALASMEKVAKAGLKGEATFGKMAAKAYSSGRTLAESFELAEQAFVARFRRITRKEAREFVRGTTAQFKKMGGTLQELAKDDGPLGLIVRKFSLMHQIGAQALIPQTLRPMVALFGSMLNNAAPIVTALGAMGLRFSMLLNPIGLVVGGLGGMIALFKGVERHALKTNESFQRQTAALAKARKEQKKHAAGSEEWKKWQERITGMTKVQEKMREIISKKSRQRTIEGIKKFFTKAKEKVVGFMKLLPGILKEALGAVKSLFATVRIEDVWAGLKDIGGAVLSVAKTVGSLLHQGFLKALDFLGKVDFTAAFQKVFDGIMNFVRGVFGSNEPEVVNSIGGKLGGAVKKAFWVAVDIVKQAIGAWWSAVFGVWSDGSKPFLEKIQTTGLGLGATLGGAMILSGGVRKKVMGSLSSFGSSVLGFFKKERKDKLGEVAGQTEDVKNGLIGGAKEWLKKAGPKVKKAGAGIVGFFGKGIEGLETVNKKMFSKSTWKGLLGKMGGGIKAGARGLRRTILSGEFWKKAAKGAGTFVKNIPSALKGLGPKLKELGANSAGMLKKGFKVVKWALVVAAIVRAFQVLPGVYRKIMKEWEDQTASTGDKLTATSQHVFSGILEMVGISSKTSAGWWHWLTEKISNELVATEYMFKAGWQVMSAYWTKAVTWFELKFNAVFGAIAKTWAEWKLSWTLGVTKLKDWWAEFTYKLGRGWEIMVHGLTTSLLEVADLMPKTIRDKLAPGLEKTYSTLNSMATVYRKLEKNAYQQHVVALTKELGRVPKDWEVAQAMMLTKSLERRDKELAATKAESQARREAAAQEVFETAQRYEKLEQRIKRSGGEEALRKLEKAGRHLGTMRKYQTKKIGPAPGVPEPAKPAAALPEKTQIARPTPVVRPISPTPALMQAHTRQVVAATGKMVAATHHPAWTTEFRKELSDSIKKLATESQADRKAMLEGMRTMFGTTRRRGGVRGGVRPAESIP